MSSVGIFWALEWNEHPGPQILQAKMLISFRQLKKFTIYFQEMQVPTRRQAGPMGITTKFLLQLAYG